MKQPEIRGIRGRGGDDRGPVRLLLAAWALVTASLTGCDVGPGGPVQAAEAEADERVAPVRNDDRRPQPTTATAPAKRPRRARPRTAPPLRVNVTQLRKIMQGPEGGQPHMAVTVSTNTPVRLKVTFVFLGPDDERLFEHETEADVRPEQAELVSVAYDEPAGAYFCGVNWQVCNRSANRGTEN